MLGLPPLPRTLAAALRDAEHPKSPVRLSALKDLVRLARGSEREPATLAIIALLRSDPSAELRAEAAVALADAEASVAQTALLAALDDPMLRVRQMALLALGELGEAGDRELALRLSASLDSSEPALRFQALIACEKLAPEQAPALLERALSDADDEVRVMALRLARQRWPEAGAPEPLLELARRALSDPASAVRAAAALWLAPLGETAADPVLVGVIDGIVPVHGNAELVEAMELVGQRGLAGARGGLARRAFGLSSLVNPLRWHALVALARLGDERARRTILRGLDAWTRDARTLAVAAAGRAGLRDARPKIVAFRGDARRADPDAVAEALGALTATGD
jgi:HEAT repeat protein